MAIQRSQREQPETLVLALLPNVNSPPFYGLTTILIFNIGKAPQVYLERKIAQNGCLKHWSRSCSFCLSHLGTLLRGKLAGEGARYARPSGCPAPAMLAGSGPYHPANRLSPLICSCWPCPGGTSRSNPSYSSTPLSVRTPTTMEFKFWLKT